MTRRTWFDEVFILDIDLDTLQEPAAVARVIRFVLELPTGTVMPETLVLPEQESSWP